MPIAVSWDNPEKTILRYDYQGRWTWDEYFKINEEGVSLIASVAHRVDTISNMKPGMMPVSGSGMSSAKAALRKLPSNAGIIVVVTNSLANALLKAIKQYDRDLGAKFRGATSIDEARTIIEREVREPSH